MRFIIVFIFLFFTNLLFCDTQTQFRYDFSSVELLEEKTSIDVDDFFDETNVILSQHFTPRKVECSFNSIVLDLYTDFVPPLYLTPPKA